jgi:hypothetical protein
MIGYWRLVGGSVKLALGPAGFGKKNDNFLEVFRSRNHIAIPGLN